MRTTVLMGMTLMLVPMAAGLGRAADVGYTSPPTAMRTGDQVRITFAVSAPTDVEVAVLNQAGTVVRHLAAGVLGGPNPPPGPLGPGLSQRLVWDGNDDFGKPVRGGPFKVRVRAGTGVKLGHLIAADPCNFGRVNASAVDEDGNVYVMGFAGMLNQGHMCLRVFDKEGRYLREIVPFPADLAPDAVKEAGRWDASAKTFRPTNRRNLNPDFYGQPGSRYCSHYPLTLVSASKKDGVVLTGAGRTYVLETTGAIRSVTPTDRSEPSGAKPGAPGDLTAYRAIAGRLRPKGDHPTDFNRITVDYDRDEVYVNNAASLMWRYEGATGWGGLLRAGEKPFYAGDVAVGYDGLLYVRKCMGYRPGVTDFSGPLERYTRDLAPAPYPSGTHVLSKYIYGRYGVGYADRGIGVGADGTVYTSFMFAWCKYCVAGFGPDGEPLKGKYLEGKVGRRGDLNDPKNRSRGYPPGLTSAVIGPITAANGGVRVDLKGDLYVGMWVWPKNPSLPAGFESDKGYAASTGSVVRFTPAGGFLAVARDWQNGDPIEVIPRTPGAAGLETANPTFGAGFLEGATAMYMGLAPFSHRPFGGNMGCVCRSPRFDLDRYGRLYLPNAVTNSVRIVDNAGNLVCEFGKYGNFDSQYVPADSEDGKPLVSTPAIPLTWPTGAGVSEKAIYVLDTYSRRVVRIIRTYAAEATCEVK